MKEDCEDIRLVRASEIHALDKAKRKKNQPSNPIDMGKDDVKWTK